MSLTVSFAQMEHLPGFFLISQPNERCLFQGASVFWLLKVCEVCYLGMLRSTVCVFRCTVCWLLGTANGYSLKTFNGIPKVVACCESYSALFVAFPSAVLTELFRTWKRNIKMHSSIFLFILFFCRFVWVYTASLLGVY